MISLSAQLKVPIIPPAIRVSETVSATNAQMPAQTVGLVPSLFFQDVVKQLLNFLTAVM